MTGNEQKKKEKIEEKIEEAEWNDEYVMKRVKKLCEEREWSIYRLAQKSGIPYSTLNNTIRRTNTPTFSTLMKLCKGFGITIGQFFEERSQMELTKEQYHLLQLWGILELEEKYLGEAYLKGLAGKRAEKINIMERLTEN